MFLPFAWQSLLNAYINFDKCPALSSTRIIKGNGYMALSRMIDIKNSVRIRSSTVVINGRQYHTPCGMIRIKSNIKTLRIDNS